MKKIIDRILTARIVPINHVAGRGKTAEEKTRAADNLELMLSTRKNVLADFPRMARNEELEHSLGSSAAHEIGFTTNIFGKVLGAYAKPLETETIEEYIYSNLVVTTKTTGRLKNVPGLSQPIEECMGSEYDIENARKAALHLSQTELDAIGQRLWGETYSPLYFKILDIKPGK